MRTYPLRSAFNATGQPWGVRSTNTGTPLGTPGTPGVPEEDEVTLSGTPQAYDPGTPGTPGVVDIWNIPIVPGVLLDGDVMEVTIAGGANSPYTSTYHTGDTPDVLFAPITAAILADGQYTGTLDLGVPEFRVEAVAAGVGHVVTGSTTSIGTQFGPAVNSQVGADAVPPVAPTPASTAAVTDGTNHYSVTYTVGTLDDLATALAAAIDGNAGYTATAVGAVITVSGPAGFVLTDESSNGVTATFNITVPGTPSTPGTADLQVGSPYVLSMSTATSIAIWSQVISGTGCTVVPWFFDSGAAVWVAQTPVVVTANTLTTLAVPAIPALYIEQKSFVGSGHVLVTCRGNDTHPGQN